MVKVVFFMFVFAFFCTSAQDVDFNDLKQTSQVSYNKYTTIHTYTLNNELYTGLAISKGRYGAVVFQFKDGKKNGVQKSTFKNGSKKGELDYKEGLIISTKSWRKDGSKKSEMYYKDGYRKSQKTWYSNGQINLKERYKRKGDYRSYYHYSAEGQLIEKGHKLRVQEEHRDRLFKVGKWFYYFDDGNRKLLEYYTKKGDLEKVRNYDGG